MSQMATEVGRHSLVRGKIQPLLFLVALLGGRGLLMKSIGEKLKIGDILSLGDIFASEVDAFFLV